MQSTGKIFQSEPQTPSSWWRLEGKSQAQWSCMGQKNKINKYLSSNILIWIKKHLKFNNFFPLDLDGHKRVTIPQNGNNNKAFVKPACDLDRGRHVSSSPLRSFHGTLWKIIPTWKRVRVLAILEPCQAPRLSKFALKLPKSVQNKADIWTEKRPLFPRVWSTKEGINPQDVPGPDCGIITLQVK